MTSEAASRQAVRSEACGGDFAGALALERSAPPIAPIATVVVSTITETMRRRDGPLTAAPTQSSTHRTAETSPRTLVDIDPFTRKVCHGFALIRASNNPCAKFASLLNTMSS